MTPLVSTAPLASLMLLLPGLNLRPDDIEGCHCIDLCGMAVLAGTWMHGFFTTPVSVGGLDPRPVVAAGQYWSSQNLLAQSNNKQPIKCILFFLLALQTATTSIHRALLTKVIFCFWFLGQKPNLILRAFKFEDNHNRLMRPIGF